MSKLSPVGGIVSDTEIVSGSRIVPGVDVSFPGNVHPERINIICFLLFAAYYPLADAHKHDKQSDCSDSELSGDRPEEDEKSDPCKGVFDAL